MTKRFVALSLFCALLGACNNVRYHLPANLSPTETFREFLKIIPKETSLKSNNFKDFFTDDKKLYEAQKKFLFQSLKAMLLRLNTQPEIKEEPIDSNTVYVQYHFPNTSPMKALMVKDQSWWRMTGKVDFGEISESPGTIAKPK